MIVIMLHRYARPFTWRSSSPSFPTTPRRVLFLHSLRFGSVHCPYLPLWHHRMCQCPSQCNRSIRGIAGVVSSCTRSFHIRLRPVSLCVPSREASPAAISVLLQHCLMLLISSHKSLAACYFQDLFACRIRARWSTDIC